MRQVLGFLTFFQATVPLMQKGGKFVFMSSGAAVLDRIPDKNDVTYGITKVGCEVSCDHADAFHRLVPTFWYAEP